MWQVYSRPRALCSSLAWGMSTTCFGATKSAGRGRGRGRWSGGAILWDSVVRGRVLKAHIARSYFHECFLMAPLQTLISCIFGYAWAFSFDRNCIWYPVKAVTQRGWLETKWVESVEDGWLVEWPVVEWLARSILEGRSTNGWSWPKEVGSAARNWGTKRVKGIDGTGWNSPWDWKCTHLFFFFMEADNNHRANVNQQHWLGLPLPVRCDGNFQANRRKMEQKEEQKRRQEEVREAKLRAEREQKEKERQEICFQWIPFLSFSILPLNLPFEDLASF